jgi:hypothetical protein
VDPAAPIWRPAAVSPLVHSPKLSGAAPLNRASRATIAFLQSDRPGVPGADDPLGDEAHTRIELDRRRDARSNPPKSARARQRVRTLEFNGKRKSLEQRHEVALA